MLMVVAHHTVAFLAPTHQHQLVPGGFIGVDAFFVLSGFLITTLLFEEAACTGRIRIGAFYMRRTLRLLPALLVVLAATSAYNYTAGESLRSIARTIVAVATYAVNWVKTFTPDVSPGLGHTWSLAVEEQFYLVWPFVLLLILARRIPPLRLIAFLAAAVLASMSIRAGLWLEHPVAEKVYFRTDARADSLLIGAALAVLWHFDFSLKPLRLLLPVALLLLGGTTFFVGPRASALYFGGFTVVAICVAVVVAAALQGSDAQMPLVSAALSWNPLRHIGLLSYGIYLWHVPLLWAAQRSAGPAALRAVAAVTSAVVVAQVSRTVIEEPFLRMKHRYAVVPTIQVPAHD